jgi:putative adhesin
MRRLLGLLTLASAGVFQSSCVVGDWGDTGRFREDFHYSWPLDSGARLTVETQNGSVEISAWDKNTIDIAGTKYASDESLLHDVRIDISHAPDSVRIRTIAPEFFHGNAGAEYTIHVPRRVVLDQIRSSNGALRVDAVEGNARMHTSNGGVHLTDVHGDADIETSNGSIDIDNQEGSLRLHTTNAHIKAESRGGRFEAETSNGSIEGRLANLNTGWPLRAETTNGHIDLDVEGGLPDMHLTTSNSSIDLRLPDSASGRLIADTSHSDITSDFDLTTHGGTISKDHLEGQIGGGGPNIEINTSNGAIHIRKR